MYIQFYFHSTPHIPVTVQSSTIEKIEIELLGRGGKEMKKISNTRN